MGSHIWKDGLYIETGPRMFRMNLVKNMDAAVLTSCVTRTSTGTVLTMRYIYLSIKIYVSSRTYSTEASMADGFNSSCHLNVWEMMDNANILFFISQTNSQRKKLKFYFQTNIAVLCDHNIIMKLMGIHLTWPPNMTDILHARRWLETFEVYSIFLTCFLLTISLVQV